MWAFLLIAACHGGPVLVFDARSCLPTSHRSGNALPRPQYLCSALCPLALLPVSDSRTHLAVQLLLLSRSQPQVPPQVPPPSSRPLPPGADAALPAASSPVSMTTRVTSAPGLSITARTPGQLNADNAFLIAAEMFLVTKKKKKWEGGRVDGRGDVEEMEEDPSFLCGDNPRCPRAPQRPRLLSEISLPIPAAVAGILSSPATRCKCLGGHWCPKRRSRGVTPLLSQFAFNQQGSTRLSSGQTPPSPLTKGLSKTLGKSTPWLCQSDAVAGKESGQVCCWDVTPVPLQEAP